VRIEDLLSLGGVMSGVIDFLSGLFVGWRGWVAHLCYRGRFCGGGLCGVLGFGCRIHWRLPIPSCLYGWDNSRPLVGEAVFFLACVLGFDIRLVGSERGAMHSVVGPFWLLRSPLF